MESVAHQLQQRLHTKAPLFNRTQLIKCNESPKPNKGDFHFLFKNNQVLFLDDKNVKKNLFTGTCNSDEVSWPKPNRS